MNKFCPLISFIGAALLIGVLAIKSRPHPVTYHSFNDSPAVFTVDTGSTLDFSPARLNINDHPSELLPDATVAHARIAPEESETQKLIDAIRAALRSGDAGRWEQVSQNELSQLIKSDPQAAADFAQGFDPGEMREQMLRQVAHGWAMQDPAAALAWTSGLTDAGDRNSTLADVCVQISQSNPAGAITAAIQHGLENQGGLYENMMQQWAAKDPMAALDWADQLPAGADRNGMMTRLAFVEAHVSPTDAANLVLYEIPPGSDQEEAIISVLHQWALKDYAAASDWVDEFPDGPLRNRAEQELNGMAEYRLALNN
jgi:hypothetical protein